MLPYNTKKGSPEPEIETTKEGGKIAVPNEARMLFAKHAYALVDNEHYVAIVEREEQVACEKVAALSPLSSSETEIRVALSLWEQARSRVKDLREWIDEHEQMLQAYEQHKRQAGQPAPTQPNLAD